MGFTLAEMLCVLAVLMILAGLLVPSMAAAKASARQAVCSSQLHATHAGMLSYANANVQRLMPFAFSDQAGDLPQSGHWGGADQVSDPSAFGRVAVSCVNLQVLVRQDLVPPAAVICPGSNLAGDSSLFPYSRQFSTYCLRFPDSEALFDDSPALAWRNGTLLGVYRQTSGGQSVRVGKLYQTAPLVRMDRQYPLASTANADEYDPAGSAILADEFWRQDFSQPAAPRPGVSAYPVRWSWRHGRRFNVLYGGGQVKAVEDDGTVRANSVPPGGSLADDGAHFAAYAGRAWRLFDAKK
ncbi:MAG: type II secretion system protein [Phycisphaerae bacterium]